jgi:hypothetical protein
MQGSPRRYVSRACAVCEWTGGSLEVKEARADCPWCHAPAPVVREEWLYDAAGLQAQAAAYGRLGGLKGGPIRAERLSPARRAEIARKAAAARWRRR